MHVLAIGLDEKVLDKNSAVARRAVWYGGVLDSYTVVTPAALKRTVALAGNVTAIAARRGNKIISLLRLYRQASAVLRGRPVDVITVQDTCYLALIAWRLVKKYRKGFEIQVHGFEKFSGWRRFLARYVLRRANAVRVVSQRLKRQVMEDFGVAEDKITVVPIYTNTAAFTGLLRSPADCGVARNDNAFIFLTIGRLVPVKNIAMQIDAVRKLESLSLRRQGSKVEKNIELWIVGDGPERKKLEVRSSLSLKLRTINKKLEIEEKVKFFGWQKDTDSFYAQADAFVLSSNSEGWGMAVVEAAAYGLPIIMTDVGLAGEVIKDGESGLIIPVGDQQALEQAMARLVGDEGLSKKLGEGARAASEQLPNFQQTLNLYKQSWRKAAAVLNA